MTCVAAVKLAQLKRGRTNKVLSLGSPLLRRRSGTLPWAAGQESADHGTRSS
jgi:hypothetical protein